jgi:hypothetical protein
MQSYSLPLQSNARQKNVASALQKDNKIEAYLSPPPPSDSTPIFGQRLAQSLSVIVLYHESTLHLRNVKEAPNGSVLIHTTGS